MSSEKKKKVRTSRRRITADISGIAVCQLFCPALASHRHEHFG
jgi:hypothetical protein